MDASDLFTAAHKLTRETIQPGDAYAVTFGACLRHLRAAPARLQGVSEKQIRYAEAVRERDGWRVRESFASYRAEAATDAELASTLPVLDRVEALAFGGCPASWWLDFQGDLAKVPDALACALGGLKLRNRILASL